MTGELADTPATFALVVAPSRGASDPDVMGAVAKLAEPRVTQTVLGCTPSRVVVDRADQHPPGESPAVSAVVWLTLANAGPGSRGAAAVGRAFRDWGRVNLPEVRVACTYRVRERVQWDYLRDWSLGQASPGVKRLSFMRRRDDVSADTFAERWHAHAAVARVHHPGIWRYVQCLVEDRAVEDAGAAVRSPFDVDGIAILHFRSQEDHQTRFFASDEGRSIVIKDVRRFGLLRDVWDLLCTEQVLLDVSGSAAS